jgi:DsbC/DsbD-like thiol-disulfide interchange protein
VRSLLTRSYVFRALAAVLALVPAAAGAKPDPVAWSATVRSPRANDAVAHVVLRARIAPGWFVYGFTQPNGGPTALRIRLARGSPGQLGTIQAPPPRVEFDPGFRRNISKYSGSPTFVIPLRVAPSRNQRVRIEVRYQACNATVCLPPRTHTVELVLPRTGRS